MSTLLAKSQRKIELPYRGGADKFDNEVKTSLIVEAGDSGRVYFAEITYSKKKKMAAFEIHGMLKNDITDKLVSQFFCERIKNWKTKYLKRRNVIIPIFISPLNVENQMEVMPTDVQIFAKSIALSFVPKNCFLYKPVFLFQQMLHIDMEPNLKKCN